MSAPGQAPAVLGGTAIKPIERHGWEAVRYFFHDPQKGTYMGRTPKSWSLITIFYIIYYSCLAAFWALMMYIFLTTIDDKSPKYTGEESVIGRSPGLGLRPSQPDEYITSSMILYNKDSELDSRYVIGWDTWKEQIDLFLGKNYNHKELKSCPVNSEPQNYETKACKFDLALLGPCGDGNNAYGYAIGKPCLYFKLNRIYGVENEPYNSTDNLPEDMPEDLRKHIRKVPNKNQVWVDCRGENPADLEAMGPIKYYPSDRGFSSEFFPYLNQMPYESPVVAVQFLNPPIGQLLHIECRAWAKNIGYDRTDRIGMVHFELLVLNNKYAELYEDNLK